MKYLFLIISLLLISCTAKVKSTGEENTVDSIQVENVMNFIEVENALKILTQGEKSIGYDMSECNLLLSDSLQGDYLLPLEKSYRDIEDLMNHFDKKLGYRLNITVSELQIPILKHKNKVFVRGDFSDEFVAGSYAYILELIEPAKLMVKLVYKSLDNLANPPLLFPITEEDSTAIKIPEFYDDLGKFMQQRIHYPESAKKDSIRGSVLVDFWVETDLTTAGFEIVQSIRGDIDKAVREDFDKEALRVARQIPLKSPAFQYGKPIRYKVTIPICFRL